MAAQTITFEPLRTAIRNRNLAPVYILHGEEGYFIDALLQDFENVLTEDEKEFNFNMVYAPRVDLTSVPTMCRRVPMMADFQMVIVKEAQAVSRATDLNVLAKYVSNPSPDTVLVIASRGAVLKGDILKEAKKNDKVVIFESKKIYDNQLPGYISSYINARGLNIHPKALEMLGEYVGADLSRLYNEIDKLIEILGPGAMVTPEAIEKHVGMSRSFNAFELVDALAAKDAKRAFRIAGYFRDNPKAVPLVMATAALYNYFSDLLLTYFAKDKSDRALMAALGIKWDKAFRRYALGRQRYNAFQVIEVIRAIRAFDRHSKGLDSRLNEHDLFHELIYHILTAPGNLFPRF